MRKAASSCSGLLSFVCDYDVCVCLVFVADNGSLLTYAFTFSFVSLKSFLYNHENSYSLIFCHSATLKLQKKMWFD